MMAMPENLVKGIPKLAIGETTDNSSLVHKDLVFYGIK